MEARRGETAQRARCEAREPGPEGRRHALAPTRCQQRNAGTDGKPGIDIRLYTSGTDVIRIKSTPR